MTSFIDRVVELQNLLGIPTQMAFTERLGMARGVYTNWRSQGEKAGRNTADIMAERWQVSLDSLWARKGTTRIEQSPGLKCAVELAVDEILEGRLSGDSGLERLYNLFDFLTVHTTLSIAGWCDWLNISVEDWPHLGTNLDPTLERAAFFVGWHENKPAWYTWLKTGQTTALAPVGEETLRSILAVAYKAGLDRTELRRLIENYK